MRGWGDVGIPIRTFCTEEEYRLRKKIRDDSLNTDENYCIEIPDEKVYRAVNKFNKELR